MPRKPKKPHWNADLKMPGLLGEPPSVKPKPMPDKVTVGHSTTVHFEETGWECLRCERIKVGNDPLGLDHTPRCPFRGSGKDPDRN